MNEIQQQNINHFTKFTKFKLVLILSLLQLLVEPHPTIQLLLGRRIEVRLELGERYNLTALCKLELCGSDDCHGGLVLRSGPNA